MEKTLSDYRNEIDGIDEQIVALFCRRMEICEQIGKWKLAHGVPVSDPGRENEKLERVSSLAGERFAPYAREVCEKIMECSRAHQETLSGETL